MKPTKNRFFCKACKQPRILFESKSKADNFIRFNANTILEENGYAPTRSYYCKQCGGWHVTSSKWNSGIDSQKIRRIKNFIRVSSTLKSSNAFVSAFRFLCYAEQLCDNMVPDAETEKLAREISIRKKKTAGMLMRRPKKPTSTNPESNAWMRNDHGESHLINIKEQECDQNGYSFYKSSPKLLLVHEGLYYYSFRRGRLTEDELDLTFGFNELHYGETINHINIHRLGIVEVCPTAQDSAKNQFDRIDEMFKHPVRSRIRGKELEVIELADKNDLFYLRSSHYENWVKAKGKNIHTFYGKCERYTCLVSDHELDNPTVYYFKKKDFDAQKNNCFF